MKIFIKNAIIINEGRKEKGSVLINDERIENVFWYKDNPYLDIKSDQEIDAEGLWLIPGAIDDQVHFREPGLTHKEDIYSGSKSAVAGGITSYMEMPNTIPQTTTLERLEEKYELAAEKSLANYSFYFGATNQNYDLLSKINPKNVCGVKVFMGSSTGNMLVNNDEALTQIFKTAPTIVAVHSEDEEIIQNNKELFVEKYGTELGIEFHPKIRSAEACYSSTERAIDLAKKHNTRLHILHLSTAKELELFDNIKELEQKKITAEVCVHHLWFTDQDYKRLGNKIKWNPAIKTETDNHHLIKALNSDKIDVVATDHAPHTIEEKKGNCLTAMSGGPLVQHSLIVMLQMAKEEKFTYEKIVEKMCHAPAQLFRIEKRGYIRKDYFADLVLIDPNTSFTVQKDNLYYKCGWSPFEEEQFDFKVVRTFVNGNTVFHNGTFYDSTKGKRLTFKY